MIGREDFDMWKDHPVTVHVFNKLKEVADAAKDKWLASSWDQGASDPLLLADLRARAEVVNDLITVSYEDIDDSSNETKVGAEG